jgi:hypothetical protein
MTPTRIPAPCPISAQVMEMPNSIKRKLIVPKWSSKRPNLPRGDLRYTPKK